jgi:hypothetical protein
MHRLRFSNEADGDRANRTGPRPALLYLSALPKGSAAHYRQRRNRGLAGAKMIGRMMYQRDECVAQASFCREKAQADPAHYDYWIDQAVVWLQRALQAGDLRHSRRAHDSEVRRVRRLNRPLFQIPFDAPGRNRLGNGGLNDSHSRTAAMRIQTYRDERRSRHFDLKYGARARSIDLVSAATASMLLAAFVCALVIPFASTVAHLSEWVR